MLSKSQARAFFFVGTGLCALAFIGLTVDTFGKIPAQTGQAQLTEQVIRGKDLWDHNNCMGCHTLLGEGAYYAPELTKVIDRRGPAFVAAMLRDPEAMYPGQRKMKKYDFTEAQIADLVAFLGWIGKIDTNGFPAKPPLEQGNFGPAANRPVVFQQLCTACHSLGGVGGTVGPALDGVGKKFDAAYFGKWLQDPAAVKPGTKMPKLPLTAEQIQELTTFLDSQDK